VVRDVHSDEVRAPALRLEGFEGEWSEVPLGSLVERVTRRNKGLQSTLPLTISAQHGLVDQVSYFNNHVVGQNWEDYFLVKNGEFAYNKSASAGYPAGTVKRLDRYESGILSVLYVVFGIEDPNTLDSDYLATYFETELWPREVLLRAAEGARNHGLLNISAGEFLDIPIAVPPSRDEQVAIGAFFKNLDGQIRTTLEFHSSLTSLKKTMLVKMFPQGTASTPEVRFDGFEGDWERSELGQVVESFRYGVNAAAVPYDGATKYLRISDIDPGAGEFGTGEVTSPGVDRRTADDFLLEDGDLVFARTGATVGRSYLYREGVGRTVWAGFLIRAKLVAGSDPDFISASVLTPGYWEYVRMTSQRSGQPGLNSTEFARLPLWLPSRAEQKAIGAYFRSLDALIEAEQKKLDTLRNLKSALLTQMFV